MVVAKSTPRNDNGRDSKRFKLYILDIYHFGGKKRAGERERKRKERTNIGRHDGVVFLKIFLLSLLLNVYVCVYVDIYWWLTSNSITRCDHKPIILTKKQIFWMW